MAVPTRISPREAGRLLKTEAPPLLVCGYDDEKAFQNVRLPSAIPHVDFLKHEATLPRTRELIFYCGWIGDVTAARRAEEAVAMGFSNVRILEGGYGAWKEAGLPVEGDTAAPPWAALFPQWLCSDGHDAHHVVEMGTELDHRQAPDARKRLLDPLKQGAHVTLDLARVTRLDTSGVAVLVEAARRARDLGACLSLGNVSDAARAALEVARIDTLFPPADEIR